MGFNFKFNRILSYLIDGLVMFILMAAIVVAPAIIFIRDLINDSFNTNEFLWLAFSIFASFCVWIIYLVVSEIIFKNATLGMRLNHLTFRRINDLEMSINTLIFRATFFVITVVFTCGLSVIFDILSMIITENGKTFHDVYSYVKVVPTNDLY